VYDLAQLSLRQLLTPSDDEMYDVATQLIAKWGRVGPEQKIAVTDDFTRLTLDSIALCVMDKRFNSFYSDKMHPFVDAMVGFLLESGRRAVRTRIGAMFNRSVERQYLEDIATMRTVAQDMVNYRRANPIDKKDLLNAMLFGKDPKTGEKMTDISIIDNIITFLIAGHETTSGLLSFVFYQLCKSPEAMRKAQQEVDTAVGKGPITSQHMSKLPYIEAVMRDALRLNPTAPSFSVTALPTVPGPVVLAGKYTIPHGAPIVALLSKAGRDPLGFGADAEDFRPERMYGDNFAKLPQNAWKVSSCLIIDDRFLTAFSLLETELEDVLDGRSRGKKRSWPSPSFCRTSTLEWTTHRINCKSAKL
jgi:cytochrome P450/NADPH-cytochrome P450 reductase